LFECLKFGSTTVWFGDVAEIHIRQPVTDVKSINKSSLFILLPGMIRWLGLKLDSELKAGHIFVALPYSKGRLW
jgi:hypothetical protein